ncbi:MAG: hypothetical protein K1X88_14200 [Nannocystaceae bacterium]|nr:hypothetical protein [Nannocystaceae bacterium]
MRRAGLVLLLSSGCDSFDLPPIELDVASNCNRVDVAPLGASLFADRDWHSVVAATADANTGAAWLLVLRRQPGGFDQVGLVHLDASGAVARDIPLDVPPATVGDFTLIAGAEPGVAWLMQRNVGIFFVARLDANADVSVISSGNLAAVPVPCGVDVFGSVVTCDASSWFQTLALLGPERSPYALTIAPSSDDFRTIIVPTPLDEALSPRYPLDPGRAIAIEPGCDDTLPPDQLQACEAAFAYWHYPTQSVRALQHELDQGQMALAVFREVADGDDPITTTDLLLVRLLFDEGRVRADVRANASLVPSRDDVRASIAFDGQAAYVTFVGTDGASVFARAAIAGDALEDRSGELELSPAMTLLQLDQDVAFGELRDGTWDLLKYFPDAPSQSQSTRWAADAAIVAVDAAGPAAFLVRTNDSAELARVRCALPQPG